MVWWAQALCDPWFRWTYPHGLVGLKAVHVVGSPEAPGGEELEEVDLHRGFNKYDVIWGQAKAVGTHRAHGAQCSTGRSTELNATAMQAPQRRYQLLL